MTTTVIELVTYKLKSGVDKLALDDSHSKVNNFLKAQPGFLYRSLSEDKNGLLHDIVYWQDMSCAEQAAKAFEQSTACASLMSITDMESVTMQHMTAMTEAMSCQDEPA